MTVADEHAGMAAAAAATAPVEPPRSPGLEEGLKCKDEERLPAQSPPRNAYGLPQRSVLRRFTLFETRHRLYYVGCNLERTRFRVLKVERSAKDLSIVDDEIEYDRRELTTLLGMINEGNKGQGGLRVVTEASGLLGFIRFLEGYYMVLITAKTQVAQIGAHTIYHVDDTQLVRLAQKSDAVVHPDEQRYIDLLTTSDLKRDFYFSYTYDLTQTLQYNAQREDGAPPAYNDTYAWNYHMWKTGFQRVSPNEWVVPIMRGFIDQSKISVYGKVLYVMLIARRSRHFAGTRFLKRGVNEKGNVANDVETEQIVQEMTTTPLLPHSPARFSSYVQHRGSIPLFWSQDASGTVRGAVKPAIQIQRADPFHVAAGLHFDAMLRRYGAPVIILNLVKQKEKTPREMLLLHEYRDVVAYLNQFVPPPLRLRYIEWDMARAAKSGDEDVIARLAAIAEENVGYTGFFFSGSPLQSPTDARLQSGVIRTNCVDCLDRTNAAQFMVAKCALAHQLHALGVISVPSLQFDCDAVTVLSEMFQDHGDIIALQYGGSHLVNTIATYRKSGGWTTRSRDAINTLKRFYSNSFTDVEKQAAINLFLGSFVPEDGKPTIWELPSDYYLHNEDPRIRRPRRSYEKWCTFLDYVGPQRTLAPPSPTETARRDDDDDDDDDDYWDELYRPSELTSFDDTLNATMGSSDIIARASSDRADASPFAVRAAGSQTFGLNMGGGPQLLTFRNSRARPSVTAVPTPPPTSPPRLGVPAARAALAPVDVAEYGRYVGEFGSRAAGFPGASAYCGREYLKLLQRSYLIDNPVRPRDEAVYAASAQMSHLLTKVGRAPRAIVEQYVDYVALRPVFGENARQAAPPPPPPPPQAPAAPTTPTTPRVVRFSVS